MRSVLILFFSLSSTYSIIGQVCNDPICHFVLDSGKKEIWHINQPPVNQKSTQIT
jgi:hypothetical protein